jgi:hypothetical protein
MERMSSRWEWKGNPALTTLTFLLGTLAAAGVLALATRSGAGANKDLVTSAGFGLWIAVAALTIVVFINTAIAGVRTVRNSPLGSDPATGTMYVVLYVVFGAIVIAALVVFGKGGPKAEIGHWTAVRVSLLVLGVIAAGPWIVSIWATHATLAANRFAIRGLPRSLLPSAESLSASSDEERESAAPEATNTSGPADGLDPMMNILLEMRKDIAQAVTRLLTLVLLAVLLSGALRGALVPKYVHDADFPASAIVVYGAFFTVMLAFAVLPLMLAWRQTATDLLDVAYPTRVRSTADEAGARGRMAATLNLNGSLFTSPVALTSVLSPLIISLLAVFVPQVGNK